MSRHPYKQALEFAQRELRVTEEDHAILKLKLRHLKNGIKALEERISFLEKEKDNENKS